MLNYSNVKWLQCTLLNVGYRHAHPSLLTCSRSAPSGCLLYPATTSLRRVIHRIKGTLNALLWDQPIGKFSPLVSAESKACPPVCRIRGTASLRYSRWTWLSADKYDKFKVDELEYLKKKALCLFAMTIWTSILLLNLIIWNKYDVVFELKYTFFCLPTYFSSFEFVHTGSKTKFSQQVPKTVAWDQIQNLWYKARLSGVYNKMKQQKSERSIHW